MPRMFAVVLALLSAGWASAGPPDQPAVRMVFVDRVAAGLRRYRAETDPSRRIDLMMELAPIRDPRIVVAFGEAMEQSHSNPTNSYPDPGTAAETLLHVHYLPAHFGGKRGIFDWWLENKNDLRRRAKLLPK
jgi:hypothetical protein